MGVRRSAVRVSRLAPNSRMTKSAAANPLRSPRRKRQEPDASGFVLNRGQDAQKRGASPAPSGLCALGLARALCSRFRMSRFFSRNLEFRGRLVRGVLGGVSLIAGIIVADFNLWVC